MASFAIHRPGEDGDGEDIELNDADDNTSDDEDGAVTSTREAKVQDYEDADDDDDDDEDSDSDDGDIPLATPYPWPEDDYELTLHHEPKKKKQTAGTGMLYLKRLVQDNQQEESKVLSARAKALLRGLMAKLTKAKHDEDDDSSEDEDSEDDEADTGDDGEARQRRRTFPGPRFWTKSLQQQNRKGFLYSILKTVDENHPKSITTRQLIRSSVLELPPGAAPGCMDAKEMLMCALHWLSSEWKSPDPTQLPNLPLVEATLSTKSSERDLEKRNYEKASDWALDSLPLDELERLFLDSPSSSTDLRWMSRIRFCPRLQNDKDENPILLKGNVPARVTGKKPKAEPGAKRPYKRRTTSPTLAATNEATSNKKAKSKVQKVNPNPHPQGKQLPPAVAAQLNHHPTPGKQLPSSVTGEHEESSELPVHTTSTHDPFAERTQYGAAQQAMAQAMKGVAQTGTFLTASGSPDEDDDGDDNDNDDDSDDDDEEEEDNEDEDEIPF